MISIEFLALLSSASVFVIFLRWIEIGIYRRIGYRTDIQRRIREQ
jgi:hypothetical protein